MLPASDTKRETSRQYRCGPLCDVHKETGPSDWPWHRGTYLPLEGTKDCNVVFLTMASRSLGGSQSSLPSDQISRYFWCLGVEVASSQAVPSERDRAIPERRYNENVSSPSCRWVTTAHLECGTGSQGQSHHLSPPADMFTFYNYQNKRYCSTIVYEVNIFEKLRASALLK